MQVRLWLMSIQPCGASPSYLAWSLLPPPNLKEKKKKKIDFLQIRLWPDEYIVLWSLSILSCLVSSATAKTKRKDDFLLQVRILPDEYITLLTLSVWSCLVLSATPKSKRKEANRLFIASRTLAWWQKLILLSWSLCTNQLLANSRERKDILGNIAWARGKSKGRSLRDFPRAQAIFPII